MVLVSELGRLIGVLSRLVGVLSRLIGVLSRLVGVRDELGINSCFPTANAIPLFDGRNITNGTIISHAKYTTNKQNDSNNNTMSHAG